MKRLLFCLAIVACVPNDWEDGPKRECRGWLSVARSHKDSVVVFNRRPSLGERPTCAYYLAPLPATPPEAAQHEEGK